METVKIHNAQTNEIIERDMNEAELAKRKIMHQEIAAEKKITNNESEAKAAAQAKLAALGLTTDDLKALGL